MATNFKSELINKREEVRQLETQVDILEGKLSNIKLEFDSKLRLRDQQTEQGIAELQAEFDDIQSQHKLSQNRWLAKEKAFTQRMLDLERELLEGKNVLVLLCEQSRTSDEADFFQQFDNKENLAKLSLLAVEYLTKVFAEKMHFTTKRKLDHLEGGLRHCTSMFRKLKMCVQKLKAEREFYKSLYRQLRNQSTTESKQTNSNLPPKPISRKYEGSLHTFQGYSQKPTSQDTSKLTSMEVTFEGDHIDMFQMMGEQSPDGDSKLNMYIYQTSSEENTIESAFDKAMERAEKSIS